MNYLKKLLLSFMPDVPVPVQERRSSVRLNTDLEVNLVMGEERLAAQVVNLTFTGLSLEVDRSLPEETEVTLCREAFGPPFNGTVMWCKKNEAGNYLVGVECELDEEKLVESWLEPALTQAGFEASYVGERRKLVRIPGRVRCEIVDPDGRSHEGFMRDLSLGGALVECPHQIESGSTVAYTTYPLGKLPTLQGQAVVRTVRRRESDGDWLLGLQFAQAQDEKIRSYMARLLSS